MNDLLRPLPEVRANPDWAQLPLFDRRKWRRVRFGDVVRVLKEQVDPASGEVDRYVAGEHMDSEDVHIRRWGTIGDGYLGPAFIRRFRKGQVLYGSRRTYLKKVAVAEFDGVTANTTLVLEAVDQHLLQRLLPWLMLSDAFTQHSIRESKGSTNPYINWPDIAKFEFALPPVEQQRRIADLLWAIDYLELLHRNLERHATQLRHAAAEAELPKPESAGVQFVHLGAVSARQPQSGIYKAPHYIGRGVSAVHMGQLFAHDMIHSGIPMERMELSSREIAKYSLTSADILFGRRSIVLEGAGKCSMVGDLDEPTVFESSILRVTLDTRRVLPGFVFEWLNSPHGAQQIRRIRSFTTVAGITGSGLRSVLIPLLPLTQQERILRDLASLREGAAQVMRARGSVQVVRAPILAAIGVS